jgi:hypothetical protein
MPRIDAPPASGASGALICGTTTKLVAKSKTQESTVASCDRAHQTITRSWNGKLAGVTIPKGKRLSVTETLNRDLGLNGKFTNASRFLTVTSFDAADNVTGTATSGVYGTLKKGGLGACEAPWACDIATTTIDFADGDLTNSKGRQATVFYRAGAKNREPELKRVVVAPTKKC